MVIAVTVDVKRETVRCPNPRCALQQHRKPGRKQWCVACSTVWNADRKPLRRGLT